MEINYVAKPPSPETMAVLPFLDDGLSEAEKMQVLWAAEGMLSLPMHPSLDRANALMTFFQGASGYRGGSLFAFFEVSQKIWQEGLD